MRYACRVHWSTYICTMRYANWSARVNTLTHTHTQSAVHVLCSHTYANTFARVYVHMTMVMMMMLIVFCLPQLCSAYLSLVRQRSSICEFSLLTLVLGRGRWMVAVKRNVSHFHIPYVRIACSAVELRPVERCVRQRIWTTMVGGERIMCTDLLCLMGTRTS